MPSPAKEADCECYEDSLTGGKVFAMYCGYCHNAPSLAERPYSQFRNVAAHMRVRANLTGKEYAKLMEFLRRWNDVPPPTPAVTPGPPRLTFSQPMAELRPEQPKSDVPQRRGWWWWFRDIELPPQEPKPDAPMPPKPPGEEAKKGPQLQP
jgi:hypothetical protein